ncbi:Alpha-glucosidase [Halanaerobium saccharolyticum subsp. saccharolyticum DSM 6643]|uniref:Alpha-glucosidase n=1 Tax=Halanaerobium saccharolyticum subsp. saccharolyticum DSM 6643 TaxID=1293054 RepID=M5EHX2_9FIRM|nr:TIM-barrel domain-containing protein [Halanaerobium saccharolyticum]CCU81150.1 Alpha-glucosidase [Halanaerobium saccharolyticum subsp. saccharolyticum DSM 6643]
MDNSETLLQGKSSRDDSIDYHKLSGILNYKIEDNQIRFNFKNASLVIRFLTADIFRIIMANSKQQFNYKSTEAVIDHNLSYNDFKFEENNKELIIKTEKLVIKIEKEKFFLQVFNKEGKLIHQDYSKYSLGWKKKKLRAWKSFKNNERFYGLGEKTGWLDKKGRLYEMWNHDTFVPHVSDTDPLYQSIPFLISFNQNNSYGIYFDNSYRTYFDLGSEGQPYYSFWAEGGVLDYYFFNGPSLKEVISKYSKITGTMPLAPKWSLGYHQSRYSYYPQAKVAELVKKFRDKEIPCDAFHFDIHYMDQYKIYTWNEDRFPDPAAMISKMGKEGIKAVTIIDPGIKKDPEYKLYQEGMENDYFCKYLDGKVFIDKVWPGNCAFPDFTQAKVRNWWSGLQQDFVELGVKGIWNDMNEPAVFNEEDTMDLAVMHQNDGDSGTHRRFHNLYGLLEDQATYKGLKESLDNERPFVLTRAGFAGIQRYSAVWTGDNRSFWDNLKLAMPMLMNMGMSGISFCGTDVGGFTGNSNGELLCRWTQLGAFSPFFRNHCEVRAISQEPWSFGKKYEKIIKKYIELRYKFITHLYNLFYQASKTGIPVMRPLIMEFPEDEECQNLSDQFMFGDSIMIAPVYQPDKDKRMIYLPEGKWFDFWTKEIYHGKKHIIIDAPLATMPILIKAGSIVPLNEKLNYIGEKEIESLELNIFLSEVNNSGSYELYDDDGISYDYQNGIYNITKFDYKYTDNQIIFKINSIQDNYQQEFKDYKLIFNNLTKEPLNIDVDNSKLTKFNYFNNSLEFKVPVTVNKITIKLS